jgi:uracil phosphoribosyltransferase|uniref:Uracil phosphoribosyltransferase n=1 Tax=Thorea hispida TaxID=202687 RepID=A0A1C9CAN3_9FLOR|nr:uracil phosphoribosyltransferase [Thorea hispida]AOM65425.1 uracil phosphoribosyltransferase [Thorea hispida]ARX95795.1 uracil phosphoribosyltransferase or UMP pyrophosphorylase [Thorea hispida]UNJ79085.1 uracil phosphoribosyltransferase [Thorea hispida]
MSKKILSIYSSSHPLIQIWVSHICYTQILDYEIIKVITNISHWLLFETTRKSIFISNLYIKQFHCTAKIKLFPRTLSHIIISDFQLMHIIGKDILLLVPKCTLHSVHIYKYNNQLEINTMFQKTFKSISLDNPVIIFEQYLDINRIILLIDSIIKYIKSIKQIKICCIISSTDALQFINKNYSDIKIYTAKIINNDEYKYINPFWKVIYKDQIN